MGEGKAQERGKTRFEEELQRVDEKVAQADDQDAAPPGGLKRQGERGRDEEENEAVDDNAPKLAGLPLGQRIPL